MSSAGDNLETLTDRQLRERCLYYGLQNVPITDTTRKLVINKLRACLSNEQIKKSALKSRQENRLSSSSSHKTNIEPPTEKKKEKFTLKNRHTLAAKIVSTDVLQQLREADSPAPKRRSERKSVHSLVRGERKSEPKFSFQSEETTKTNTDDVVFVEEHTRKSLSPTFVAATPQPSSSIPVLSTKQPKKSRSPSLSKSVVVTTSYGKEQKSPTPILELDRHVDREYHVDRENQIDRQRHVDRDSHAHREGQEDLDHPLDRERLMDQSPEDYENMEMHDYLVNTSNNIPSLHNPQTAYHHIDEPFPIGYKPIYPNINVNSAKKYSAPDISKREPNRGIPIKQTKSFGMHTRPHYFESDEDENIEAHTPFLSDFAKRLSRLKAEPIDLGIDKKEEFNLYHTQPTTNPYLRVEKKLKHDGPYIIAAETELQKNSRIVNRRREIFAALFLLCLSILLGSYYYPIKL